MVPGDPQVGHPVVLDDPEQSLPGPTRYQVVLSKWSWMVSSSLRWTKKLSQVVLSGPTWSSSVPSNPRWS